MKRANNPSMLSRGGPAPDALAILVVEDDAINQLVLSRLLERRGHAVTVADNGPDALDLLCRTRYDCVIMDVELPGLDGPQTVARLRDPGRFGRAARTPVVGITAHTDRGIRERLLAGGFDEYVAKPLDMATLEAALGRVTAGRSPRAGDAHGV